MVTVSGAVVAVDLLVGLHKKKRTVSSLFFRALTMRFDFQDVLCTFGFLISTFAGFEDENYFFGGGMLMKQTCRTSLICNHGRMAHFQNFNQQKALPPLYHCLQLIKRA